MPAIKPSNATAGHASSSAKYTHGLSGVNLGLDALLTQILWMSIMALVVIILFVRFGHMANAHLRHLMTLNASPTHLAYWKSDKTWIWPKIKNKLIYAPLINKRHNKEIMLSKAVNVGTIPSRLHTLILVSYLIINLVYCVWLDYRNGVRAAVIAELRGRSGHLALVNMVPLIVLAGRNNPFIYLLRVSFDTYNLFHRWIGRLVVVEAAVHTIAWAVNKHAADGSRGANESILSDPFLAYGLLGVGTMGLIMLQSPSVLRHAFYETFLHCHQLLALAAIIGVWIHCKLGHLPGTFYIHLVVIFWALDRALRLIRILYCNVSFRGKLTHVTVEALPGKGDRSLEACRVSFELARPLQYHPGRHCYVYLPSVSFWMNHPFSIAWSSANSAVSSSMTEKEIELESPVSDLEVEAPDFKQATQQQKKRGSTIHIVMARRTGMTAKLYDLAAASPSRTISLRGMIEGPYGSNTSLHSYGTVVLFAAGIGITHQIGHVRDLLHGNMNATTSTQKIVLVWSIKSTHCLEWIRPWMDNLLTLPNRKRVLKVMLFITRAPVAKQTASRSETVLMFGHRCDPRAVLEREVAERVGAMAVTCCGPGMFGDDVRNAVRECAVPKATCDFVEEAFTW